MSKKPVIAIIGTGMIGGSQSALFAGNGYPVKVLATKPASVEKAQKHFDRIFDTLRERGLASEAQIKAAYDRLSITMDYADLADAEVVYESVSENLELKHEIYQKLKAACPNMKVLASATSALLPDDLAEGTGLEEIILVAHPFNPPHMVPLVELVRGSKTTDAAMDYMHDILEDCGRVVIVMKKAAKGFIANRLQAVLVREACYLMENGYADARDIDAAATYSFMPRYTSVGLFEHQDASGMNTLCAVGEYLNPDLCNDTGPPKTARELRDAGHLGIRTGQGFYSWSEEEKADYLVRSTDPFWRFFDWKLPLG